MELEKGESCTGDRKLSPFLNPQRDRFSSINTGIEGPFRQCCSGEHLLLNPDRGSGSIESHVQDSSYVTGVMIMGRGIAKTGAIDRFAQTIPKKAGANKSKIIGFMSLAVGILSTLFSLFMSNVGAIVVLAPLVISMAQIGGLDPRPLVLMAAVSTSNSFILPTHQVNALLMSSGGDRNADYLKAGSGITLIFLAIAVFYFYLLL